MRLYRMRAATEDIRGDSFRDSIARRTIVTQ
jgi:hypothetical protein